MGTGCIVTDVTVPHTWYNVNQNNNRLFFRVIQQGPPITITDVGLTLTPQNYDLFQLREALEVAINAAMAGNFAAVRADPQAGTLEIVI